MDTGLSDGGRHGPGASEGPKVVGQMTMPGDADVGIALRHNAAALDYAIRKRGLT